MKKTMWNSNILIIGYGSVSRCTLPILLEHIDVPREKITIIDFEDKKKDLQKYVESGIKYFCKQITRENLASILSEHAGKNSIVIDLAWNIGANDILKWCHDNNALYVNTSVEEWDPVKGLEERTPYEKSLYFRQMELRELMKGLTASPTAVLDHGANPGLISHFTKQALLDIAGRLISEKRLFGKDLEDVVEYRKSLNFPYLAEKLGVKAIHCSERDTQITNRPKEVDEFVGTWSIEGLREEGTAPAEMGWGTHEAAHPPLAHVPPCGPKNQIFLAQMGINTFVRSWIPEEEIVGMVIRHGEAFGISDRLTVWENGKARYRPTVHYAYMPCHETLSSLWELKGRGYQMQSRLRIMSDEITHGADILGALVMGHAYNSWWCGSILDIHEARKLVPGQNATTIQVALGVVSAVKWMIENPQKGICLPDDLPHDYVLDIAKPYLGKFISQAYDWTPIKNRKVIFKENPASKQHPDPWQFQNFTMLP
jgi:homospermidine synthase